MKAVNSRPKKHGHQLVGTRIMLNTMIWNIRGMERPIGSCFFPVVGWQRIDVTNGPTAEDLACQIRKLVDEDYPEAVRITLAKDNLNTHVSASLYKEF